MISGSIPAESSVCPSHEMHKEAHDDDDDDDGKEQPYKVYYIRNVVQVNNQRYTMNHGIGMMSNEGV